MIIDVQPEINAYFNYLSRLREELIALPSTELEKRRDLVRVKGKDIYEKALDYFKYTLSERANIKLTIDQILQERTNPAKRN